MVPRCPLIMHAWKSKQTKTLATLLRLAEPRPRALQACPLSPFSTLFRPLLGPLSRLFEMLLVPPVVVETFFFFFYEPLEWGCGVGEGGEGGGQLTFRHSGLERNGLRSLTEARELLLLLRRLGCGALARARNQRAGLRGSCLHPAWPRSFLFGSSFFPFFFFCFIYLFGTFINSAWPSSVLSTEFKIQFVFRVPHLCRIITAGRREPREFNVEL